MTTGQAIQRAVIALALLLASPARGEIAVVFWVTNQPQFWIVNDNNGAVYDSYTLLTGDLLTQIWNANPRLHTIYSNVAEMAAMSVDVFVIPDSLGGEVNDGWMGIAQGAAFDTSENFPINNVGGFPLLDYDAWYSTSFNSNQDLMAVQMYVDDSLLDLDGDGWTAGEDLVIENDTNQVVLLGVAQEGVTSYNDYAPRPVVRVGGERGKVAGLALNGLAATSLVAGAEVSIEEWRMECWSNGVVECWSTQSTFTATGKVQRFAVPMTNDAGWFRLRMRW